MLDVHDINQLNAPTAIVTDCVVRRLGDATGAFAALTISLERFHDDIADFTRAVSSAISATRLRAHLEPRRAERLPLGKPAPYNERRGARRPRGSLPASYSFYQGRF